MIKKRKRNQQLRQEVEDLRQELTATRETHQLSSSIEENRSLKKLTGSTELIPTPSVQDQYQPSTGNCLSKKNLHEQIRTKSEKLKHETIQQAALENQYQLLRSKERNRQKRERAIVLERKTRPLEQYPGKFQFSADDELSLEDHAAVLIQRAARGVQGRTRVTKLRPVLDNAATLIQGIARGHLSRLQANFERMNKHAMTNIQRVWRGYISRMKVQSIRLAADRHNAARNIQRIVRGCNGRQRMDHKRSHKKSARVGAEVVGIKQLFHEDLLELVNAIESHQTGSLADSLPGIGLGVLKVVVLMLEDDESVAIRHNSLGKRSGGRLKPSMHFSWEDALLMLRRSSYFLRRLRQLAEGPTSRRPRILYISQNSVRIYKAIRCDPNWNVTTLSHIGRGAKALRHLMMWVDALQNVFAYQREFADNLDSDWLLWVTRTQQNKRRMRHLKLSRMVWEHAVTCLEKILRESQNSVCMLTERNSRSSRIDWDIRKGNLRLCVVEGALGVVKEHEMCAKHAISRMEQEEDEAQKSDEACERYELRILEANLEDAQTNLTDRLTKLENARKVARDGMSTDNTHLQLCLSDVVITQVICRECGSALGMYRIQSERYAKLRGLQVEVWRALYDQGRVVGELEAASILAIEDMKNFRVDADPDSPGDEEFKILQSRANEARSLAAQAQLLLNSMEGEEETVFSMASEAEVRYLSLIFVFVIWTPLLHTSLAHFAISI